jgi:hypothetical protein
MLLCRSHVLRLFSIIVFVIALCLYFHNLL